MPNLCYNKITFIGHREDLTVFKESKLDFQHFFPAPENADFEWYRNNWGTSGLYAGGDFEIKDTGSSENLLIITNITRWSPPAQFLKNLLQLYPRSWIKLEFQIEGCESGLWIGYLKPDGSICEKSLVWQEPDDRLTVDGNILLPEETEAEAEAL